MYIPFVRTLSRISRWVNTLFSRADIKSCRRRRLSRYTYFLHWLYLFFFFFYSALPPSYKLNEVCCLDKSQLNFIITIYYIFILFIIRARAAPLDLLLILSRYHAAIRRAYKKNTVKCSHDAKLCHNHYYIIWIAVSSMSSCYDCVHHLLV
jgi:hypothetical protein